MKTLYHLPGPILFVSYYIVKLADVVIHPLKGFPMLDFNNQYDSNIL